MSKVALTFIKALLSIPIGIGLAYPFVNSEAAGGTLNKIQVLGTLGFTIAACLFLILVLFYARDLARSLTLVSSTCRKAKPKSVWLMFLLPYNFIEDFFIVINVTRSLEAEARINPALARFKSFGLVSGLGWCTMQIISLVPNRAGSAAGVAAVLLWLWHWAFIRRANATLLRGKQATNSS